MFWKCINFLHSLLQLIINSLACFIELRYLIVFFFYSLLVSKIDVLKCINFLHSLLQLIINSLACFIELRYLIVFFFYGLLVSKSDVYARESRAGTKEPGNPIGACGPGDPFFRPWRDLVSSCDRDPVPQARDWAILKPKKRQRRTRPSPEGLMEISRWDALGVSAFPSENSPAF